MIVDNINKVEQRGQQRWWSSQCRKAKIKIIKIDFLQFECYRGWDGDGGCSSAKLGGGGGQVQSHILIGQSNDSLSSVVIMSVATTGGGSLLDEDITPGHAARHHWGSISIHDQISIESIQVTPGLINLHKTFTFTANWVKLIPLMAWFHGLELLIHPNNIWQCLWHF